MHCKFFSIMNWVGRIKGMDMQHTLQRNVRDQERSEGANEPKLAITRDLQMSDVQLRDNMWTQIIHADSHVEMFKESACYGTVNKKTTYM